MMPELPGTHSSLETLITSTASAEANSCFQLSSSEITKHLIHQLSAKIKDQGLLTLISPYLYGQTPTKNLTTMPKTIINTNDAPAPIGPYNQSVKANGFLFMSGQIAINPLTNSIEATTVEEETEQVMKNLEAVLSAAGMTFSNVVKTTIFLSDMALFSAVNEIYGRYFPDNAPARETVAVKGLPRNMNVEISMIAV